MNNKKINFVFDLYEENCFLPNGINPNLLESYRKQKQLEDVDWDTFFKKMLNEHHFVMDRSGKYIDTPFAIFYTRTLHENVFKHLNKESDTLYSFDDYEITLKHIDEINSNETNYYLVNLFGNEDFLFMTNGPYALNGNDIQTSVSYLNFNSKVIDCIKEKKLKLIIATFHEGGVQYDSFLKKLYNSINHFNLDANDIIYVNADAKNNISFDKFFLENNITNKVKVYFTNYLISHSLKNYSGQHLQSQIINKENKDYNFLFFNRAVFKDHRLWALGKLKQKNVLENSLYSIIFPYEREIQFNNNRDGFGTICTYEDYIQTLPYLKEINDLGIVKIDNFPTTKRVNYDDIDPFATTFISAFENSYISIVSESTFSSAQISEKIAKPLRYLHPFIVIGGPHYLKKLKEFGFKTFDKWWDESYDDELDDVKRMDKVLKLIVSLNDSNNLKKIYEESKDVVLHNARHCQKFSPNSAIQSLFKNIFENEKN